MQRIFICKVAYSMYNVTTDIVYTESDNYDVVTVDGGGGWWLMVGSGWW
jgi:hypothetical protein